MIGFAVVMGLLGGVFAALTGIDIYRAYFGIIVPFLGFWILEALRKQTE
jgi:hypothetical protein